MFGLSAHLLRGLFRPYMDDIALQEAFIQVKSIYARAAPDSRRFHISSINLYYEHESSFEGVCQTLIQVISSVVFVLADKLDK